MLIAPGAVATPVGSVLKIFSWIVEAALLEATSICKLLGNELVAWRKILCDVVIFVALEHVNIFEVEAVIVAESVILQ